MSEIPQSDVLNVQVAEAAIDEMKLKLDLDLSLLGLDPLSMDLGLAVLFALLNNFV